MTMTGADVAGTGLPRATELPLSGATDLARCAIEMLLSRGSVVLPSGMTSCGPGLDWTRTSPGAGTSFCADVCVRLVDEESPGSDERNQKTATTSTIAKPRAPIALTTTGRGDLRTGLRRAILSRGTAERSNGRPRALQKSSRFFRLVATKGWLGSRAVVAIV